MCGLSCGGGNVVGGGEKRREVRRGEVGLGEVTLGREKEVGKE